MWNTTYIVRDYVELPFMRKWSISAVVIYFRLLFDCDDTFQMLYIFLVSQTAVLPLS